MPYGIYYIFKKIVNRITNLDESDLSIGLLSSVKI